MMSLINLIPAVWSASLLEALDNALVYAQTGVVNRDYEGEISQFGDRVKINSLGRVTVRSYSRNSDIESPEELTSAQQELVIDQGNYFNFQIDDVDQAQMNPKVRNAAMSNSAYELAAAADTDVAGIMVTGAAGKVGTSGSPKTDLGTAGKAYDYLVDLAVALDDTNTPRDGRWVVVPPWYRGLLVKDAKFVGYGTPPQDARLRNGLVGEAAGFNVLISNNVPKSSTTFRIIAGHGMATSYAEQILDIEAMRMEKRFANLMRGLHVYGRKVVRPDQLAVLFANKP
jgi:hypothetical protein